MLQKHTPILAPEEIKGKERELFAFFKYSSRELGEKATTLEVAATQKGAGHIALVQA
jgi:hypothetical protein